MRPVFGLSLDPLRERASVKVTVLLIAAALLPALQRSVGGQDFYRAAFGAAPGSIAPVAWFFGSAFVLWIVVPVLIVRVWFRESLATSAGVSMGDARFGWKWVAIAIVPFALLGMSSAGQPDFRATYPFWRGAGGSASAFVMYELFRAAVFYLAWEFFYRGFIQFGLAPSIGPWNAILVQTLASCLWHIGLPTGELLSSIAGGIFFGIIAWRSGSWIYPLILHIALGVSLDAAVCFF